MMDLSLAPLAPSLSAAVIYKPMADGAIIFSTENEVYYGLNQTGARVWEQLAGGARTLADVVEALKPEFPEVEAAVLLHDVEELVRQLLEFGLATPRAPDAADTDRPLGVGA